MKTNTQLTIIDHKEYGLDESKANSILEKFEPLQTKMAELEGEYQEIIAMEVSDPIAELKAKELGKKYMKIRTGRNAIHKEEKDFFLNAGRFIDRIKNDANASTIEHEDKLEVIAKYHANLEAQKIKDLESGRLLKLKEFDFDGSLLNLGLMDESVWLSFLSGTKLEYENKLAIAKQVEEDRIKKEKEEQEAREIQAKENERLRVENEAKEKQLEEERRLAKIESDKQALILAQEQEKNNKLALELKAKQDAEILAQKKIDDELKAKKIAQEKEMKAPDKTKLLKALDTLQFPNLELTSEESKKIALELSDKLVAYKNWATLQIKTL